MIASGPIKLVVEDDLSEMVCRRILSGQKLSNIVYGRKGFGFIKANLLGFNRAAKFSRYFVLTDLDQFHCAPALLKEWLSGHQLHPNLVLRVAVREVESWILADSENLKKYLAIKTRFYYGNTDDLKDPKKELLALAEKSTKRTLREALVLRTRHGNIVQGPDYNGALRPFVEQSWDPIKAKSRSQSLSRALAALKKI